MKANVSHMSEENQHMAKLLTSHYKKGRKKTWDAWIAGYPLKALDIARKLGGGL